MNKHCYFLLIILFFFTCCITELNAQDSSQTAPEFPIGAFVYSENENVFTRTYHYHNVSLSNVTVKCHCQKTAVYKQEASSKKQEPAPTTRTYHCHNVSRVSCQKLQFIVTTYHHQTPVQTPLGPVLFHPRPHNTTPEQNSIFPNVRHQC